MAKAKKTAFELDVEKDIRDPKYREAYKNAQSEIRRVDSWVISGAQTFTAIGDTAKGVAKELLSNVDSDVTSILLRVNFFDLEGTDEVNFDGDMMVIR